MTWQEFIIAHGRYASVSDLAQVLGIAVPDVDRFRRSARGACRRLPRALDFGELFALWHGRPPADEEWPAPCLSGSPARRAYIWQRPELALLATLVGTISVREISSLLTERLRRLTGDPTAERSPLEVQIRLNHSLGLQSGTDLVGGLTTRDAAKRVGRLALVNQAIANGHLRTFRVGKRHVIPREEFERWLATRQEPPAGWVKLASLREPLGIQSDKLPEYAKLGHIPDVVNVRGIGTARGTWFIAPDRAKRILADAVAGRPMPWHGKPLPGNQRAMWAKWQARRHRRCAGCRAIWKGRAPVTFDDFCARYGSLTLGEKRHLTLDKSKRQSSTPWRPRGSVRRRMQDAGVTVEEAAALLQRRTRWVRAWIRQGLLEWGGIVRDELGGEAIRITPLGIETLRAAAADEDARLDTREWMGVHLAAIHAAVSITTMHHWQADAKVDTRDGRRGIEFSRESVERQAREYWRWAVVRYKRADPPAWLRDDGEAA